MSYYKYHVFICTNRREGGEKCCDLDGSGQMRDYAKSRVKALRVAGQGGVRINSAGCLDRCAEGPVMVIYPDETWYTFVDQVDIDEIIQEHLINGRKVKRLLIG